ncbi:HU family DNA-binding protein [Yoonia sp.]|uniref:HU family DNA-binding protein n=1 Tax=Yoonia sp. TaxID=2212373 RepID=UPI003A4E20A5
MLPDTPAANEPPADTAQFKKPDLLEQIVARTTLKKRDAKTAVDAALTIIGEAIARGDDVVLPPLGKLRVIKSKDLGEGAQAVTLKLRTTKEASQIATSGLATDAEDD